MTAVHACSEDGFINTVILGNGWRKNTSQKPLVVLHNVRLPIIHQEKRTYQRQKEFPNFGQKRGRLVSSE